MTNKVNWNDPWDNFLLGYCTGLTSIGINKDDVLKLYEEFKTKELDQEK